MVCVQIVVVGLVVVCVQIVSHKFSSGVVQIVIGLVVVCVQIEVVGLVVVCVQIVSHRFSSGVCIDSSRRFSQTYATLW